MGVQPWALPISLFRLFFRKPRDRATADGPSASPSAAPRGRKSVGEGKRVDLGGRRIIKKKSGHTEWRGDGSSAVGSSDLVVSFFLSQAARQGDRGRALGIAVGSAARSEERRGGKEGRSRWSPYH